jgi:Collagen triple helix repeat (20 copies)
MTDAARRLSDVEIEERKHLLREWGVGPKPSADVVSLNTKRRGPLGLRPLPDDEPEREFGPPSNLGFSFLDGHDQAQLDMPATMELVYVACDAAASMCDTVSERAKEREAALSKLVSDLRGELVEARHEIREMKLIQESMRVANRGERGVDGARGVPGRDGHDGRPGPRGEKGAMGPQGPRPVSFEVDDAAFTVTMLMSDGRRGPTQNLRPLFEAFNDAINATDDMAEADAARAQRDAAERAAAASRT